MKHIAPAEEAERMATIAPLHDHLASKTNCYRLRCRHLEIRCTGFGRGTFLRRRPFVVRLSQLSPHAVHL